MKQQHRHTLVLALDRVCLVRSVTALTKRLTTISHAPGWMGFARTYDLHLSCFAGLSAIIIGNGTCGDPQLFWWLTVLGCVQTACIPSRTVCVFDL